jgi:Holliday junction resolvase
LRAARVDRNQKEIVEAFRKFGCSVLMLHTVGHGCPDIAVGKNKKTVLVEIKDGEKTKSGKELTKDEQKFHDEWQGSLFIVENLSDVISLVRGLER